MTILQAKLMGGGSSINGGTALRSTRADSDEWMAMGNDAWDFGSVYHVHESLESDPVRGTRGPHPIILASEHEIDKIRKAFLNGVYQCGFPLVLDLNVPDAEGAGPSSVCRRGDDCVNVASTFIDPVRHLPNSSILSESLVDRITFSDNRATGILLANKRQILTTHEVILNTGAILSPAILQPSEIGPFQLLHRHGILAMVDLPVGLSAYDHPCIPIVIGPRPGSYDKVDYSFQCQARWSSSLRPGTVDRQLVCFSYLFVEPPNPQVQQRSLACVSSGHVAAIG